MGVLPICSKGARTYKLSQYILFRFVVWHKGRVRCIDYKCMCIDILILVYRLHNLIFSVPTTMGSDN
jgi:hypothetical protein